MPDHPDRGTPLSRRSARELCPPRFGAPARRQAILALLFPSRDRKTRPPGDDRVSPSPARWPARSRCLVGRLRALLGTWSLGLFLLRGSLRLRQSLCLGHLG